MSMTINVNEGEQTIAVTDASADPDQILQAHGIDPESVSYTVEIGVEKRLEALEQATGVDGSGQNGIAHRIDDLEQRISDLESHH